jgi:hypothetical protein
MMKNVLMYGMVGLLAAALIGGTAYVLARPETERATRTERATDATGGGPSGQGAGNQKGGMSPENEELRSGKPFGSAGAGSESHKGDGSLEAGYLKAAVPLTAEEVPGVVSLVEEEKLARDVYRALSEQWEDEMFGNIAESEQSHMDALIGVLERAGVSDPTAGYSDGEFATAAVRELYVQFTAQGGQSLAAARQAAGAIEELDIRDIQTLQAQTGNPELLRVLENLRQGSIRHLRAYSSSYARETGGAYAPQYLSQEEFDLLMGGSARGNRGGPGTGGKGNGGFPG